MCATLNNGGAIDEVDRACRPAREAPEVDSGSKLFMRSWKAVADQLAEQARASEEAGHLRTAGQQWYRSGLYVCQAERMLSNSDPTAGRSTSRRSTPSPRSSRSRTRRPAASRCRSRAPRCRRTSRTRAGRRAVPCVIMWNGLDSTKEHMYTSGWPQEMRERGVSVLMVDCPGRARRSGSRTSRRGSRPSSGPRPASTTWSRAATSTRTGSAWRAGRWAATTAPAPPPSRSG